ncbi:hypothetical protein C6B38_03085 [Spiroplasma sp. ChiS]|uniref:lipoprotein n=1 Tax=Spiroplasma sp. ChiS TaxID=2099885 RepID=UPI000CF9974D|nr:lipoprotein [Spiroplasma sp. ChiS]PQP78930.1 hypothetical protein C6B38_03085 [Spiroplasma sp. ChiS]
MKKWLSFLGAITLLGTSTTSLVACNNIPQYNEDELQQLKQENQICTNCKEIKENLEWICPQEKPFNTVYNKYYYVVWRGDKNDDWRIVRFKNYNWQEIKTLDNYNNYKLLLNIKIIGCLFILVKSFLGSTNNHFWNKNYGDLFKVYRWNGEEKNLPNLIVDNNYFSKIIFG